MTFEFEAIYQLAILDQRELVDLHSRCIGMVLWTNREEVVPCNENLRFAGMAEHQFWIRTLDISS